MTDTVTWPQLDRIEAKLDEALALLADGTPPGEPDDEDNNPPEPPDEDDQEPDEEVPGTPSGKHPSQVIPLLRWWTIMLPTGSQGDPDNLYLVDKSIKDVYYVNTHGEVVFECPAGGVHSPNSKYARSEGRQMVPGREWAKSAWRSGPNEKIPGDVEPRHQLFAELAIDMLTLTGRRRINGLQIHDGGDDVMQVQSREDGSLGISHNDGNSWEILDPIYPSGEFFTCRITVQSHMISVQYVRGAATRTVTIPKKGSGWYWKAGAYLQTGGASEHRESPGARGRVTFRRLDVTPA